jgi:hypothetical protein
VINLKFHIVRTGETLEDILFLFNLTKDELVEENRHIRIWDRLVPGTKLKIPAITEVIEQDVNEMEPFIEDYYPKLTDEQFGSVEEVIFQGKEETVEKEIKIDEKGEEHSIKTIEIDTEEKTSQKSEKPKIKTATKPQDKVYQSYLGNYNYPRNIPYTYIVYPVYFPQRKRR